MPTANELHTLCPKCRKKNTYVIDSRYKDSMRRRRRKCESCKHRWTTYEVDAEFMAEMQAAVLKLKNIEKTVASPTPTWNDI